MDTATTTPAHFSSNQEKKKEKMMEKITEPHIKLLVVFKLEKAVSMTVVCLKASAIFLRFSSALGTQKLATEYVLYVLRSVQLKKN